MTDEQVLKPSKESILSTKTTKTADVDDDIRDYLEANDMSIVSCNSLPSDLYTSEKPAKTINVKCICPFAQRQHKSNHCYVIVNETGAYIKCHDEECKDRSKKLDWVPRKQAEPMQVDWRELEEADSAPVQPEVTESDPDDRGNGNEADGGEAQQAIIDLLHGQGWRWCFLVILTAGREPVRLEAPGSDHERARFVVVTHIQCCVGLLFIQARARDGTVTGCEREAHARRGQVSCNAHRDQDGHSHHVSAVSG
eukprot:COSAG06_NODE_1071_length_10820_cov_3.006995_5_plen_253_part_00